MRKLSTTVTSLFLMLLVHSATAGPVTSLGNLRFSERTIKKSIPKDVKYVFNRNLGAGRIKKATEGQDGESRETVTYVLYGGKVLTSKKSTTVVRPPEPAVIEMGSTGFRTSRGAFSRSKVMTMESTAYLPTDGSPAGLTATGRKADFGVVAVDPRVIPLNSLVYVEGYGFAIAADTGGAIKGNIIDVCFTNARTVRAWGRRKVVVHVFKEKVPRKR